MLLAVDIGNTTVHFGVFDRDKLVREWRAYTKEVEGGRWKVEGFTSHLVPCTSHIIICSVAPEALKVLKRELKKAFRLTPIIAGEDIKVPLKNLYKNPEQVGQDRLVGAYAAYKKYGGPAIIVDFGTAITIDVVSRNAKYLGGVIVPGIDISLDALAQKTSLLPRIKLTKPAELIARDTANSITSGIVYGFSSLCDGMIQRFKVNLKSPDIKVIATGGYSKFIAPYCNNINKVEPCLVLNGLWLISTLAL